eukprot:352617-Chlamydomonas_euryale.AAC.2
MPRRDDATSTLRQRQAPPTDRRHLGPPSSKNVGRQVAAALHDPCILHRTWCGCVMCGGRPSTASVAIREGVASCN